MLPGAFPNLLANGSAGIAVGMATNIPPHNAAELCDAALHLIKHPNATLAKLMEFVPGPDFPTGGIIVDEPREALAEAYRTGRGGIRVRARWTKEDLGRGTWVVVVTEIPYQVQKSRLIEAIAGLVESEKLPLVADFRDESAEDVRIVVEPRSRSGRPGADDGIAVPHERARIALLAQHERAVARPGAERAVAARRAPANGSTTARACWCGARSSGSARSRSGWRCSAGCSIAYLNIDEVIRIIREEDDPKAVMMARWDLTDVQVEAILNMRLRALRKLEEIEIRTEFDALKAEQADLEGLRRLGRAAVEVRRLRDRARCARRSGRTRRSASAAPASPTRRDIDIGEMQQAMIEREPVTVILSEKGWIRALRGPPHRFQHARLQGRRPAEARLPRRRRPTRCWCFRPAGNSTRWRRRSCPAGAGTASRSGSCSTWTRTRTSSRSSPTTRTGGWSSPRPAATASSCSESELVANTRKGKQVLNVAGADEAKICVAAEGDMVAVRRHQPQDARSSRCSSSRRWRAARACGCSATRTARFPTCGCFRARRGCPGRTGRGGRITRTVEELRDWLGDRAQAGRLAPQGFPKSNRFGEVLEAKD